ncbi:MAG TPA: ABC transporter permease [Bryobacteraceae bacterium]|nr:ABC transporter permease [Bryobacteraceae bacterium]
MLKTPAWKDEIAERLAGLDLPPAREAEIIDELAGHMNDEYRRLLAGGATADEALELTLDGLNSHPALSEAIRRVEPAAPREPVLLGAERKSLAADLWRDLRYAVRTLKKSPGFTALAVVSLALGIGGNAAMFSIVRAVLIQPLPFKDPGRLVQATNTGYYPPGGLVDLQEESRTMDLGGYVAGLELNLTGQGEPWRLRGSAVSANLFTVLGTGMELGRAFQPGEDRAGNDSYVILSHALWRERFGGDTAIVGRVVTLGGVDRQIVGVAPRGFVYPGNDNSFWIPLHLDSRDPVSLWSKGFMPVVARVRRGATLVQAQREIQALSRHMIQLYPYPMGRNFNAEATVVPLQQFLTSDIRTKLIVLQSAIGLVLLIACVNVAGLLLARATSRQKEMALRVALGAARGRIIRQLLTESLVLAFAGGAIGIALAYGAFTVLQAALPPSAAGGPPAQMGAQVLAVVCLLSLVTGLAFGLAPALSASRQNLAAAIKSGSQRLAGVGRARLRSALIVGEVALAVVLTMGAGLLIHSLWRLAHVNPGFQPQRILTLRVSPNEALCRQRETCIAFYRELLRRTRDLPGVADAAAANTLPLAHSAPESAVKVEGLPYVPAERTAPMFWSGAVTPDYFRVMGIPLLQGRTFGPADAEKAAPVIIVSAATARHYWPGQNPIGKHVQLVWEDQGRTVIGVAGDVRQYDLADRSPDYIVGALYMPYPQAQDSSRQLPAAMTLIVHTNNDTARVVSGIRELVRSLNSNVPVGEIQTMVSVVAESTRQSRSMMWLFVSFAGIALVLAAVGAYGVVSYSTMQRTFEIGVRVALGAGRRRIFGLVLGQSLRLVLAGLAIGLAASLALNRMLATFLYGTAPSDPATLAVVCGLLVLVALLAGFMPARKAAGVDPLIALRAE